MNENSSPVYKLNELYGRLSKAEKEHLLAILEITDRTMLNWLNDPPAIKFVYLDHIAVFINDILNTEYDTEELLKLQPEPTKA